MSLKIALCFGGATPFQVAEEGAGFMSTSAASIGGSLPHMKSFAMGAVATCEIPTPLTPLSDAKALTAPGFVATNRAARPPPYEWPTMAVAGAGATIAR